MDTRNQVCFSHNQCEIVCIISLFCRHYMPGTPVVLVGMKKDLRQSVAATNSLVPEDTPGQVAKTIGENPFHYLTIALCL